MVFVANTIMLTKAERLESTRQATSRAGRADDARLFELRSHYKIIGAPQVHAGSQYGRPAFNIPQTQTLPDYQEMHLHLHSCKVFPNAVSRSHGKWQHR